MQVISDIHLEFRENLTKYTFLRPLAPILVLCGDISTCGSQEDFNLFIRFIIAIYDKYEHIIYVAGNHEFYTNDQKKRANTMDVVIDRIKNFAKHMPKLHFLNNSAIKLNINGKPYYIAGTTLWTKIIGGNDHKRHIKNCMNDYVNIFVKDEATKTGARRFRVDDMIKLHADAEAFLKRVIARAKRDKMKVIVLTHHCPIIHNDIKTNPRAACYEVDMSHLMKDPIVLWCYGHTHKHYDAIVNGVHVVSNPLGYPSQRDVGYSKDDGISIV